MSKYKVSNGSYFTLDFVLTENLEHHPIGTVLHTRKKDRLSYSHEEFVIDLTQVTTQTSAVAAVCFILFSWVINAQFFLAAGDP